MSAREIPMPIPVGAPHLESPPTFDRWGLGNWRANRLDRRDYTRREAVYDLWLIDLAGGSVLRCKTDDISDAGLHATAPIGFGLAIGQRWELRIANTADGRQLAVEGRRLAEAVRPAAFAPGAPGVGTGNDNVGPVHGAASPDHGRLGRFGQPLGYGTIIRTEILIVDGRSDRLGIAVRFDVPQLVPV